MADNQQERSFQKQPTIFQNKKIIGQVKKATLKRYTKVVGLGFKAPTETERGYQKQPTIFLPRKGGLKKSESRFICNPGLGFKIPREAREGHYIDKKCPFTGKVSIRGRVLTGVITKLKMKNTCVIRRDYLHYIKKYNRFEKRHKNMSVHISPCFRDVQVGDIITVGECRPLSKTVKFNTLKINKSSGTKKSFKKF